MEENKIYSVVRNNTYYEFPTQAAATAFEYAFDNAEISAASEWAKRATALLRNAERVLNEGNALTMVYEDNGLLDLIMATPDGEVVPGMLMNKQRALQIGILMQELLAWVAEPLETAGAGAPTRRRVIVQR